MKKQTEIFVKLVNELINDVISYYANDAEDIKRYAFGWRKFDKKSGIYGIGPNQNSHFHYVNNVVRIAEGCGMSWYITVGENAESKPCAIVIVY